MSWLTQNSELKKDYIWNWTLPAYKLRLPPGEMFNVCPNAGVCKDFCYARNGTYLFRNVRKKHLQNLQLTFDRRRFVYEIVKELSQKKNLQAVRIHDAGDFYSLEYLQDWATIAGYFPHLIFYAYTKQVQLVKDNVDILPENFLYIFSLGRLQDHLIDREVDRHAEVFPDEAALEAAGYFNQSLDDIQAVTAPTNKIGIPANNIRHYLKRMGDKTFSELNE